jgi:putative ABC transport system substrate-binding protein
MDRAASFVDNVLESTMPSDLPLEQPTTFEPVIDLIAAGALGVTLPRSLLRRADEETQ